MCFLLLFSILVDESPAKLSGDKDKGDSSSESSESDSSTSSDTESESADEESDTEELRLQDDKSANGELRLLGDMTSNEDNYKQKERKQRKHKSKATIADVKNEEVLQSHDNRKPVFMFYLSCNTQTSLFYYRH